MSGSRKKRTRLEIGHDSFLDIVANLVGILIILVVVLGTQSQQVIEQARREGESDSAPRRAATEEQMSKLASFSMRAASAQADSNRLESRIKQIDFEIENKRRHRAALLDLLSEAKDAWDEEKKRLDHQATLAASRNSEHAKLNVQLASLRGERERLADQKTPVVAIEHLPTPMAKTVFGEEVHFRLKGNRVSYVPLKQLESEVYDVLRRAAAGSRSGVKLDRIGPLRGYVASLRVAQQHGLINRGGRVAIGSVSSVQSLIIEPLEEPHGEPIQKVGTGQSVVDIELAGLDPGTTTVTVWVYPDSFAAFRRMKEYLYSKGFPTAGRPMSMDFPIGFSPHGSKSRAQ